MKRIAIRDAFLPDPFESVLKVLTGHRKSVMLVSFGSPRRNLQSEIVADPDNREWPVLAFQLKAQDIDIEIDARGNVINVQNQMVDCRHPHLSIISKLARVLYSASH